MRRRLRFILQLLVWAMAAIVFVCWLAGWFVFAKLETALYVSAVSTGAVCFLLVALISGFARGDVARRIDGMVFSQLKRMLRIRFSLKSMLWLVVVVAAFFGGMAFQRRETERLRAELEHSRAIAVTNAAMLLQALGLGPDARAAQVPAFRPLMAPSRQLELQDEDYEQVRCRFRTTLRYTGGSPQAADPNHRPQGVNEIAYRSGGLTLKAYVDPSPGDGQKRPAVLFLHGGFAFGDGDLEMAQPYRDAGNIVMLPVLRGENGQPGNFTLFYDEVEDVLGAADALATLEYVDSDRLYVAGHSAGGTLTMLAAMASARFRAAASLSGSPDQRAFMQGQTQLGVFDVSDDREFQVRSPLAYAGSFKCPVRLFFGTDEMWAFPSSLETARRGRERGLDVEAVMVPGDHSTSVPEAIRRSIEFFRQH